VDRHRRDAFAAMHPHVRTDLTDFLTPEVTELAKEVLACHSKTITESSSVLDVLWPAWRLRRSSLGSHVSEVVIPFSMTGSFRMRLWCRRRGFTNRR